MKKGLKLFIYAAIGLFIALFVIVVAFDNSIPSQSADELAQEAVKTYMYNRSEGYEPIDFSPLYVWTEKALKANKSGYYDKVFGSYLIHTYYYDAPGYGRIRMKGKYYLNEGGTYVIRDEIIGVQE